MLVELMRVGLLIILRMMILKVLDSSSFLRFLESYKNSKRLYGKVVNGDWSRLKFTLEELSRKKSGLWIWLTK